MVNFLKHLIASYKVNLIVDAVKVIRDILKNPDSSSERERKHFRNVAISEVYLEATPTVFLYIMLFAYIFITTKSQNLEVSQVLFGTNAVLYSLSFTISLVSAAFGIAR